MAGVLALMLSLGLVSLYPPVTLKLLEFSLNQSNRELFNNTLRLGRVNWKEKLGLRLEGLSAGFQGPSGPVTFEIRSVESRGSVLNFFRKEGLILDFQSAHLSDSPREGFEGMARIRGGKNGFFELRAQVKKADLQDFVWINPDNLKGSEGKVQGELVLRQGAEGEVRIRGKLQVEEPGGKLPAHFFDLVTPYLPLSLVEEKVKQIRASGGRVGFRVARLEMEMADPQAMNLFLHLAVPDYNLDLHLKMDIRFRD